MTILHIPYTYFPDAVGGTEIYVHGLVKELKRLGYISAVAAPGRISREYVLDSVNVHRYATDSRSRLDLAYGAPDEVAASGFRRILKIAKPRIVHLHAHTSAVSCRLVDVAHELGARVVFTYHTPTVSCARGDMMHHGVSPCDGRVEYRRCAACALRGRGLPGCLADLAASMPRSYVTAVAELEFLPGSLGALRVPGLIAAQRERFHQLIAEVDHIIAVCQWVGEVLATNGAPHDKLTLSRQGISVQCGGAVGLVPATCRGDNLRIAYFGRTDSTKGPDLLGKALALVPQAKVSVDIFAIQQSEHDPHLARLVAQSRCDPRLRIQPAVAADDVRGAMRQYDLVAVPSRWLETGPLVVLEAFAAGVPVIGASHGGIAELVRNGKDGVLVEPSSPRAWADAISRLASDQSSIEVLRSGIRPPRTMADVASDMAGVYAKLGVQPWDGTIEADAG
jgi:glycosyltransferase involved in cell wall biosynthesis